MNKQLSRFILIVMVTLFSGFTAMAQGYETTVPFTETFDDESHYTLGGDLPDGWATYSSAGDYYAFDIDTYEASEVEAHSGNSFVSSYGISSGRRDVLFTPVLHLEANTEYTISAYIFADSYSAGRIPSYMFTIGSGQTIEEQTDTIIAPAQISWTAWTQVTATYTPTETGDYSIGFNALCNISSSGFVYLDDFSVQGPAVEPPVETWEPSIPYIEDYDDATHYDGVGYLPIGWYSSGENIFFTASSNSIPAISGTYYMITTSSVIANRNDVAYSPMLTMEAGVDYVVSFYLCMPGDNSAPSFKFAMCSDQDVSMQEGDLLLDINNERIDEWQRYEFTVTPATTAEYCFAFQACSEAAYDGYICVDNFRLRRADDVFAPIADFEVGNVLYSVINSYSVVFPTQEIDLINTTVDADSYTWSVSSSGATISDPAAVNPTITFENAGSYKVTLEAVNAGGTSQVTKTINVVMPSKGDFDCLQTTNDSHDKVFQQAECPAFREDGSVEEDYTYATYQNYVVGVNQYYRAFAERFDVPVGCEVQLTDINFITHEYYLWDQTVGIYDEDGNFIGNSNFDADKKLSIVIYSELDGKPNVQDTVYCKTGRIADMIRDDYHSVRQAFKFDDAEEPVVVNGPFYVALEFDSLSIEPFDPNVLSRSYIGCDTRVHTNGQTTLWVKPESAIPGSVFEATGTLGEYCRADEFSHDLVGYSFCVMPWVIYGEIDPGSTGIDDVEMGANTIKVYASLDGENYRVAGVQQGDHVMVYAVNGNLVYSGKASNGEAYIPTSGWSKGVYVISVNGNQSIKVIK